LFHKERSSLHGFYGFGHHTLLDGFACKTDSTGFSRERKNLCALHQRFKQGSRQSLQFSPFDRASVLDFSDEKGKGYVRDHIFDRNGYFGESV
jgi:hypothetical protein